MLYQLLVFTTNLLMPKLSEPALAFFNWERGVLLIAEPPCALATVSEEDRFRFEALWKVEDEYTCEAVGPGSGECCCESIGSGSSLVSGDIETNWVH